MLYLVRGLESKKIYTRGTKQHCHRFLQRKYPYEQKGHKNAHAGRPVMTGNNLLPEVMIIRKG